MDQKDDSKKLPETNTRKLVLSKTTLKRLTVRSGVKTGELPPTVDTTSVVEGCPWSGTGRTMCWVSGSCG